MSDCTPNLDSLPPEILHRVVLYLPPTFSSLLNLCFTSRRLYATCYSRFLFKHCALHASYQDDIRELPELDDLIILTRSDYASQSGSQHEISELQNKEVEDWELETCESEASNENSEDEEWWPDFEGDDPNDENNYWDHDNWGPDELQRRAAKQQEKFKSWPEALIVFNKLTAGESARVACAVEKANQYFNVSRKFHVKNLRPLWEEKSLGKWLPQLIALGYFYCVGIQPETLQLLLWDADSMANEDELTKRNPSTTDFINAGFCMVALLLYQLETMPRRKTEDEHLPAFYALMDRFQDNDEHGGGILEDLEWALKEHGPALSDFNLERDRYAILILMLFKMGFPRTVQDKPFPSLHCTPVAWCLDYPVPFGNASDGISKLRLPQNHMVEYLSGEWTGGKTHKDHIYKGWEMSPQFKIIQIDAREATSSDLPGTMAVIEESSHGEDRHGPFPFRGMVDGEGDVWIRRVPSGREPGGPVPSECVYRGALTPFGIVGVWGGDRGTVQSQYLGYFWLWKTGWCSP